MPDTPKAEDTPRIIRRKPDLPGGSAEATRQRDSRLPDPVAVYHYGGRAPAGSHSRNLDTATGRRRFLNPLGLVEEGIHQSFDYVHYNPVKHGLVKSPSQWPWSSFHRCVRSGVYPENWASGYDSPPCLDDLDGKTGE